MQEENLLKVSLKLLSSKESANSDVLPQNLSALAAPAFHFESVTRDLPNRI